MWWLKLVVRKRDGGRWLLVVAVVRRGGDGGVRVEECRRLPFALRVLVLVVLWSGGRVCGGDDSG